MGFFHNYKGKKSKHAWTWRPVLWFIPFACQSAGLAESVGPAHGVPRKMVPETQCAGVHVSELGAAFGSLITLLK